MIKKIRNNSFFLKKKFQRKKNLKGDIYKIINKKSKNFSGFGELYLSSLNKGMSKGWNFHKKMTLNLFVVKGRVMFFLKRDKKVFRINLNEDQNEILTVKPKVWVKMVNLSLKESKILNFANLVHNKNEIIKKETI
tara:strand:- start:911 stop:1318 length:408 start_codon:yes stop_codon:yes gene_type:complete